MATATLQEQMIEKAYQLHNDYEALLEVRAANRTSLRGLAIQGLLTPEQESEVMALYPPKQRGRRNGGE